MGLDDTGRGGSSSCSSGRAVMRLFFVRATYESSPLGKVTILELPKGKPSLRAISWAS